MQVQLLIEYSSDLWIVEFANGFKNYDTMSHCVGSLRTVARTATEQFGKDKEMDILELKDFDHVKSMAELCLKIFSGLYSKITLKLSAGSIDLIKCWTHIVVFSMQVLTQHLEANLWTTDETNAISKTLMQDIKSYIGSFKAKDILNININGKTSGESAMKHSVFGRLLIEWKPLLLRDTWRQNPMAVAGFQYCLQTMTFPHLSEFIEQVLPPSLLFLDDYNVKNKEMGIECLMHIIKNTSAEELRWYGRADVIYEALKHQMYSTEETLLQWTYPAILEILKVVVKPSSKVSDSTRYDEIIQMVLQSATHENKLVLRRIHTEYLSIFFETMGISVVKHLQGLLELVEEYLDTSDAPSEQSRINVLKALNTLIVVAWPRMKCHTYLLTRSLIKLIHKMPSESFNTPDEIKSQVIEESVKCLELLLVIDTENVRALLTAARQTELSSSCISVIDNLISKS